MQWEEPAGTRDGSYGVCLDDGGDYYVGQSLDNIADPWTGAVAKDVSPFWSWFGLGVLGFVALILIPVGIISYVGALNDAKDPDPRIKGLHWLLPGEGGPFTRSGAGLPADRSRRPSLHNPDVTSQRADR